MTAPPEIADVPLPSAHERFWAEDPSVLLKSPCIFPTSSMDPVEKLNALTRLSVIVAAILWYLDYKHWPTILLASLLAITIVRCNRKKREQFTIVPTFNGTDLGQTSVAPLYAEEWQIPPPSYDLLENQTESGLTYGEPLYPQQYPHGQFLSTTNMLPSDEYGTHVLSGGQREARNYFNNSFLRHDLAHRENMTRILKKKMERRFRHNTQDTFSPFESY